MNCTDKWAHDALDRLFVGDMEGPDFERLRKHAASCESCSEQYDRVSRADAKLSHSEVLSSERLALLQRAVLDRAELKNEAERAAHGKQRWWMPALGFAMAAAVAVAIAYVPKDDASDYQARGKNVTATNSAFGIRAFCLDRGGLRGEALPGGKLKCPPGSTLQLTYTAPKAADLSISVDGNLPLFPQAGGTTKVVSGVDVPLDFSTPISAEWLSKPAQVKATFTEDGKTVESVITVEP